jgi:hypothetical protein
MYRQLLHASADGLKLSRGIKATVVQGRPHIPWWSEGMEESGRMVISYDNLIRRRLWLDGCHAGCICITMILPLLVIRTSSADLDTMLDVDGLPPVPHPYWVDRLNFNSPIQ